ncbi:hypothetical protein [Stutzerimonas stutzeri]|uniref:hypothetical protein n=1 Tax=Stutzerimonas stutzeri TaxID=316 RepID=UPI00210E38BB|nr:hypothetical protein [Stutzerimonas stutzeri]MCQ4257209.1 hypothetical protein [Stutzerimonas stutzeri]
MKTTKLAALTLAGLMSTGVFAAGTSDSDHMKDKDGHGSMDSGTHSGTSMDGKSTDDTNRNGMSTGTGTTTGSGQEAGPGTGTGTGVGNTTGTGNSATGSGTGSGSGGAGGAGN